MAAQGTVPHVQRAVHREATPPPSGGLRPSMCAATWKKDSTITDNDLAVPIDTHIVPGSMYLTAEGI